MKSAKYAMKRTVLSRWPGLYWVLRRWVKGYLEPEVPLLPELCDPKAWAVDVGSNWGAYSFALSQCCAGVVCFEPQPTLARVVRSGLGRKGTVVVHNVALSDRSCLMELRIPRNDIGYSTVEPANVLEGKADLSRGVERLQVPCCRLDDVALDRVGFIKIDAEGHELEVIKGGLATIQRDRPTLLVETEERHRSGAQEQVLSLLSGLGYRCFILRDGQLQRVDVARLRGAAGVSGVRNFIFIHETRKAPRLSDASWPKRADTA